MTKLFSVAVLAMLVATPAWSQVPNPCPPGASTTGSAARSGDKSPASPQAMEHSAIVPDAGGENSAAPTVQQNGKSVEAQTECPKPPNQLNNPAKSPSGG